MKLDKLLLAVLTAGMFASCSNEENDGVTLPETNSSKSEISYIAVNVNGVHDRTSRADDGNYENGTEEEQKVTNAHFFFFDSNGNAFALNAESLTDQNATTNHIVKNLSDSDNEQEPNVETITNAVLAIQNSKDELPTQMVVVLNWEGTTDAMVNLSSLRSMLLKADKLNGDNGFVMSNSVYAKNGNVVDATPITPANIATDSEAALQSPIEVYVERVAAKVTLNLENLDAFDTGVENPDATVGGNIIAKIEGWDVNTVLDQSYILKNINLNWKEDFLGHIIWNDIAYRRSYWANSTTGTYDTSFSWDGVSKANEIGNATYCAENAGENATNYTKILAAAKFVDKDGNEVQVARLFNEYLTIDDLKKRIAASLAESYYYGNDENKTSIAPEHINFEAASKEDSYKVTYKLTDEAKELKWYKYDGANYNKVEADDVEARLATLTKAEIWNGMGYYFVNIEHMTDGTSAPVYGVVRNHSYVITVEGIKGLGTAVYDPNNVVDEPINPVETESFIAARINVLSWKLVNQKVTLE